jgi:hypothetical protein
MKKSLGKEKSKIFILGAGASVDYGLPVWSDLALLVRNYLENEEGKINQYKKEILEWLDLIGEDKKYKTLDECIYHESSSAKYKENGQDIEFGIFHILKEIFDTHYKKEISWIKNLNEKIRKQEGIDWHNLFFINYNYDNVLADNILDFSYLSKTERERIHRDRISNLDDIRHRSSHEKIPCLYPNGLFKYPNPNRGFLYEESDTINSYDDSLHEAVSCYHSKQHEINFSANTQGVDLYILGLGGGLKINLDNIFFSDVSKIKNIHITIRSNPKRSKQENEKHKKDVIDFLKEKFNLQEENIKSHEDCLSLIEDCFSDFLN